MQWADGAALLQAAVAGTALGLIEPLAQGSASACDLSRRCACHTPSLRRLLRALTAAGLVVEHNGDRFELSDQGQVLRDFVPGSLRNWLLFCGQDLWPLWGGLAQCARTGESARRTQLGAHGMDHLERDPAAARRFHRAMSDLNAELAGAVLSAGAFDRFHRIVDIGGGHGTLLTQVLLAHRHLLGIVFDRPHAIAGARERIVAADLEQRCETVPGDFFESIPRGADGYLLQHILHDWNDVDATHLLRRCAEAMPPEATLLNVETVMPEHIDERHARWVRRDLNMLVGPGGRERTETEYATLLHDSGLSLRRSTPVLQHRLLEAVHSGT